MYRIVGSAFICSHSYVPQKRQTCYNLYKLCYTHWTNFLSWMMSPVTFIFKTHPFTDSTHIALFFQDLLFFIYFTPNQVPVYIFIFTWNPSNFSNKFFCKRFDIFDLQLYYTGAGHIIRISSKSWFISLIPFKKWNLYNVYIHSTQTDIFQVCISFNFDDYNWQLMKTPNSVSQKIRILLKTNTKKGFLEILANWKVWTWKVWACTALNT